MITDTPVDPPADDRAHGTAPAPAEAEGTLELVQRCGWTLVWVGVLASGLQYWGSWSAGAWAVVLAPVLVASPCRPGRLGRWVPEWQPQ